MAKPLGVGVLGKVRRKLYRPLDLSGINPQGTSAGPLVKAGTSALPLTSSTPNVKFFQEYVKSSATSGDNRCRYTRLYLSGAGGGGECLRAFTTVQAACGTAHGAHLSLNFSGATTGELSGLGVAARCTLHIPNDAAWAGGTLASIQAEIWADGAASDSDGLTELSFFRVAVGGTQAGIDDIEDDAYLFSLQGFTSASGSMVYVNTTADSDATLRIKIGATDYFIMCKDAEG